MVCMYGGDCVLVRCSLVGITSTHTSLTLAVHGRSGFLFSLDHIKYVEVVLNIQVFFDETSPTSRLLFINF